jgi:hypothetical protein
MTVIPHAWAPPVRRRIRLYLGGIAAVERYEALRRELILNWGFRGDCLLCWETEAHSLAAALREKEQQLQQAFQQIREQRAENFNRAATERRQLREAREARLLAEAELYLHRLYGGDEQTECVWEYVKERGVEEPVQVSRPAHDLLDGRTTVAALREGADTETRRSDEWWEGVVERAYEAAKQGDLTSVKALLGSVLVPAAREGADTDG